MADSRATTRILKPLPWFSVSVHTHSALDTEEKAAAVVQHLLANPAFAPDRYGGAEPLRKLTPDRVRHSVDLIVDRVAQQRDPQRVISDTLFGHAGHPQCHYRVAWQRLPHAPFSVSSYSIEQEYVERSERLGNWLRFTFGLLALQEAWYARFCLGVEFDAKHVLRWQEAVADPSRRRVSARKVPSAITS